MAKSIVGLARKVASLGEVEYANLQEWVKFLKTLPQARAGKGDLKKGKKKRKYTRKKAADELNAAIAGGSLRKPRKKRALNETFPKEEKA